MRAKRDCRCGSCWREFGPCVIDALVWIGGIAFPTAQWKALLVMGLAEHTPASLWTSCFKWHCQVIIKVTLLENGLIVFLSLGMSGQPWSASYIWYPGPLRGARPGATQWPSSQPPSPRSCAYFLINFLIFSEGGRQLVRGTVLFVNHQRPARFCCLRGLMFYFKGMCLILRHVECLGIWRRQDKGNGKKNKQNQLLEGGLV